MAPRLGAFTEGVQPEAKLYWQAGDPDPRPPPKLGLGSWAVSQRRAAGPAPGVSRARPATAAAAALAPNVLVKDWQYYKFQPGPAADAPRRADGGRAARSTRTARTWTTAATRTVAGTHRVHLDRMHFVLPERATSEAELPPTLWTGMPSMLLGPGYPSAAAAVKKRVADEEAAARAKLSSQCGARADAAIPPRKGVREALEDEIASWATDALQVGGVRAGAPLVARALMASPPTSPPTRCADPDRARIRRVLRRARRHHRTAVVEPEPQRPQAVARVRRPLVD